MNEHDKEFFKFSCINHERKNYWDKQYFYRYSYNRLMRNKRVLDIGCGRGGFLQLGEKETIGFDFNIDNLKSAKQYSPVVCGNVTNLPFSSLLFDGIHCAHVIEHLTPDEAYCLLKEINRVLKSDGVLIITAPVLWDGFFDDFTHIKPYYPNAIKHYLSQFPSQRTKKSIGCNYSIEKLMWRYAIVPFSPVFFSRGWLINTISMWLSRKLYQLGVGKYQKSGYTIILNKKN